MTPDRISRDHALERMRHTIREDQPDVEEAAIAGCLGRVCAQDLFAARSVPAQAIGGMDGYAFSSEDTQEASQEAPVRLLVAGQVRPSTPKPEPLAAGQAVVMLTGGLMPPGADCVIPKEEAVLEGDALVLSRPYEPFEHVRAPGSELKLGTRVVRLGEEFTPSAVAALAISGVQRARIFKAPKVEVLAVGNELTAPGDLPKPGLQPADNLLLVDGLLRLRGMSNVCSAVCPNEPAEIVRRLRESDARCVITTGGTGPGGRDFMLQAALDAGFTPLFTGLALQPGKSVFAAARGDKLLIALPGPPWAVFALMHALVLPAMCWLRGRTLPVPGPVLARPAGAALPTAPLGWERLIPCVISALGAELQAKPLLDRSREARLDMLQAHGLLLVSDKVEPGDLLPMIPIWENRRGHRLG